MQIIDVDQGDGDIVSVSPVLFKTNLPDTRQLIPVVLIVNTALKKQTHLQLDEFAANIVHYLNSKVQQSGNTSLYELQTDCNWTRTTR